MRLSVFTRRLEMKHTWRISRSSADFKENAFIRLEADGTTGMGEAAHNIRYDETKESMLAFFELAAPVLEKADPWKFVDLMQQIHQLKTGQNAAKAAIDLALMDWITQKLGLPLYRYLGLDPVHTPTTSYSIGIDTPESIKAKIQEASRFPILKIKLGSENDEAIMKAVREATNRVVRVDANEAWDDPKLALEKIQWLATLGVEFVEQPMRSGQLEHMAWLKQHSPLPIIADEDVKLARDIPSLAPAYHGINIKLMKSGGIQEALRMIHTARAHGLKIMLGCMIESSLAITAAAHLSPLVDYADLDGNLLLKNDPFEGATVDEHGQLQLPERPGLGILPRDS
ncbi:MAG: dipeptide epimerase [Calditrichaeota bacterium]|nr:MAG: dipeptide epimerase [Calditrichota bacterium]